MLRPACQERKGLKPLVRRLFQKAQQISPVHAQPSPAEVADLEANAPCAHPLCRSSTCSVPRYLFFCQLLSGVNSVRAARRQRQSRAALCPLTPSPSPTLRGELGGTLGELTQPRAPTRHHEVQPWFALRHGLSSGLTQLHLEVPCHERRPYRGCSPRCCAGRSS